MYVKNLCGKGEGRRKEGKGGKRREGRGGKQDGDGVGFKNKRRLSLGDDIIETRETLYSPPPPFQTLGTSSFASGI